MASVKNILGCIGANTSGSVLRELFGFRRSRVPINRDSPATTSVSVLGQIRGVQGNHIHINVIRVGFDALSGSLDDELETIDYATYRTRIIFDQVNLGVGRVAHYVITAAEADGMDNLGSTDEADDLIASWSVPDAGVDAFVVRNISDTSFVGKASAIPGSCDKESKEDGIIAGEIGRTGERFARTFAHEIGHHLGLKHNHGRRPDCPDTTNGCNNLMAQTRCATNCGGGVSVATLLDDDQGSTMRGHCAKRNGC